MKKITLLVAFMVTLFSFSAFSKDSYYYQIKIYHFKSKAQEERLDKFLQDSYVPALHRSGIKNVGVFKPITQDTTDQLIYVFIPFAKFDQILSLNEKIAKDAQYLSSGKDYLEAAWNNSPYTRMESILLKAFSGMPAPAVPNLTGPKKDRFYELRSYESSTESLHINKVDMFNKEEMPIFTKLNFNAVFYGQVIAGSKMPNLMYMTTFNNKADRDKHWAEFTPAYRPVSQKPEYAHNTSKNTMFFIYPTEYSDF